MFKQNILIHLCITLISLVSLDAQALSKEEKSEKLALIKKIKSTGGTVYAMIPKKDNSPFFDVAAQGCKDSAKKIGVNCIYYGSEVVNARLQVQDILDLIATEVDGLAISAIRQDWIKENLGAKLKNWGKPVVAFDSPLSSDISKSYIGTNNYILGKKLGKEVRKLKPDGGYYCIQTERPDSPNHNDRIKGIVDGLTQDGEDEKIWHNSFSCPISNFGDYEISAVQMIRMIRKFNVDIFISTGGGSQFIPEVYRKKIKPYKEKIKTGELIIANIDTTSDQLEYLREGISTLNIGQRPYEMGRWSIIILDMLTKGENVPLIINTGLTYCNKQTVETCTK